jgi:23S rRNA pseudouridine1911/1915/1917 synthase
MCNVVYEDNHLLIVEKPPNLLTQGDQTGDECLLDVMKRYLVEKYHKPGDAYLGCVHRLDRPVGGLVALAKTGKAAARLSEQLRAHAMRREYLAVVCGANLPEAGTLTDWLVKDDATGSVYRTPDVAPNAQHATLTWQRLATDAQTDRALLHICLETGRKHQIRVQLAGFGHPIVQDLRYGSGEPGEPIALWGAVLTLIHPIKKESMIFISCPQGKAFEPFSTQINVFLVARKADGDQP